MDSAIVINNLSVQYTSKSPNKDNHVLKGIDLHIHKNEFLAVVGKSGCGKTTLLNAMIGSVAYQGAIVRPKLIGLVSQQDAIFPWMTVEKNITFGISEDKSKKSMVDHFLTITELTNKKHHYPHQLSGGQKKRVAIAQTLASNPQVILLDEPFANLDVHTREKMQNWLLTIHKEEKTTIILVTHSIDEAIFLADRVLVLDDKVIKSEHKTKRIKDRLSKEFIRLKKVIKNNLKDKN